MAMSWVADFAYCVPCSLLFVYCGKDAGYRFGSYGLAPPFGLSLSKLLI